MLQLMLGLKGAVWHISSADLIKSDLNFKWWLCMAGSVEVYLCCSPESKKGLRCRIIGVVKGERSSSRDGISNTILRRA